jgi:hypothetical protein
MVRGDQNDHRSIPAKVRDFLRDRPGRIYCDTCIQQRLGLKWRQQAQLITATLGVTSEFDRGRWLCSTCNQTKFGISARREHQDSVSAKGNDLGGDACCDEKAVDQIVTKLSRST